MSVVFEIQNSPTKIDFKPQKKNTTAAILTEAEMVKNSSQKSFESNSVLQKFNPAELLKEVWKQQNTFEKIEDDYSTPAFYDQVLFESSKTVHLVVPFLSEEKEIVFPVLYSAIDLLDKIGAEKIVLQMVVDQKIVQLWSEFESTYSKELEGVKSKIFLGSLGDQKYAFSEKLQNVSLATRVMLNPVLSFENEQYESIDQYLKMKLEARYYQNYDIYTEEQLQFFPQENNTLEQIRKALELNSNGEIFPLDNTAYSFERNDQIWILDFQPDRMAKLLEIILELNTVFGLNQTILSNLDYGLEKESSFLEFQVNSNNEYYPIFNSLSVDSLKADFEKLKFEIKTNLTPELELEKFLKDNLEKLTDETKDTWINLDYKDFWKFDEAVKMLGKFADEANQNVLFLDTQNNQIQATHKDIDSTLLRLETLAPEKFKKSQKDYQNKELQSDLQKENPKIPLFAGLFLIEV